jgi:hypothetical protein
MLREFTRLYPNTDDPWLRPPVHLDPAALHVPRLVVPRSTLPRRISQTFRALPTEIHAVNRSRPTKPLL